MSSAQIAWAALAVVLAGALGGWAGDHRGHARGVLQTQARHDAEAVRVLTEQVKDSRDAINRSRTASTDMREALTLLERSGRQSTLDLKDALQKSKPGRVQCDFDADSMRLLGAAADTADARAAGGVLNTLPAGNKASK